MLNDMIPIVANIPIAEHPNGITIVPLADAHYGSQEFNEVRWHKAIKRIYDDPHCYAVLVGDLINNGLKNSVSNVYDDLCSPREQKRWLMEELKPIAPKILAACGGNHERRTIKEVDQDPLYDVMFSLNREGAYRQNIAFLSIRLVTEFNGRAKARSNFAFAITHGSGGGMYIGSSANKTERFGTYIDGIDGIITAHTHRPVSFPVSKLVFDTDCKTIKQRQFVVAVASSFLDYGGYPTHKMLTPTAHVTTEIKLTYNQDGYKEVRVLQ